MVKGSLDKTEYNLIHYVKVQTPHVLRPSEVLTVSGIRPCTTSVVETSVAMDPCLRMLQFLEKLDRCIRSQMPQNCRTTFWTSTYVKPKSCANRNSKISIDKIFDYPVSKYAASGKCVYRALKIPMRDLGGTVCKAFLRKDLQNPKRMPRMSASRNQPFKHPALSLEPIKSFLNPTWESLLQNFITLFKDHAQLNFGVNMLHQQAWRAQKGPEGHRTLNANRRILGTLCAVKLVFNVKCFTKIGTCKCPTACSTAMKVCPESSAGPVFFYALLALCAPCCC